MELWRASMVVQRFLRHLNIKQPEQGNATRIYVFLEEFAKMHFHKSANVELPSLVSKCYLLSKDAKHENSNQE